MMRLLRNAVILFGLIPASIGTVVLAARSQPLPERLAILHLDQCAPPCWIGITPGKHLSTEEIDRIIKRIYPAPIYTISHTHFVYYSHDYTISSGDVLFEVEISRPPNVNAIEIEIVDRITIHLFGTEKLKAYSLGEFHNILGVPTLVWLITFHDPDLDDIIYKESDGFVNLFTVLEDNKEQPKNKQVAAIVLSENIDYMPKYTDAGYTDSGFVRWKGFLPARYYGKALCLVNSKC